MPKMEIIEVVKKIIMISGISRKELADRMNISESKMSKMMRRKSGLVWDEVLEIFKRCSESCPDMRDVFEMMIEKEVKKAIK